MKHLGSRIWTCLAALLGAQLLDGSEPASVAPRIPELAITNSTGAVLPLFSSEAYRAEFRYLQRELHRIDLRGEPKKTDGWHYNIAETEWPYMSCAYFGYACVNLAKSDAALHDIALAEVRWLLAAMKTRRLSGFMDEHFGPPFATNTSQPTVFVHGHWLELAMRYREASGDESNDAPIHRVARLLSQGFAQSDQGILKSYATMWWLSDNLPALSALRRYDASFKRDLSVGRHKFLNSVQTSYLDSHTGLMATYVNAEARSIDQGPRGISTMYGLHFLPNVDMTFARQQYELARKHFIRNVLGVTGAREFPEGAEERGDIDSGPIILGLGPSASGFAIAACATAGDSATAWKLAEAAAVMGMPAWKDDQLHYTVMPVVGQAVVLFGKSTLTK